MGYGNGAKAFVGEAIAGKDMDTKCAAFVGAMPWIEKTKAFYVLSTQIGAKLPRLADELAAADTLEHQQALVKLFADVLAFIVAFDGAKLLCPAIQNDFSFYRRMYNKMAAVESVKEKMTVADDEANMISMFIAQPTPMLSAVTAVFMAQCQGNSEKRKANLALLANMANILCSVAMSGKITDDTVEYCLRAMAGAIVVFDHVDAVGAFHKKSAVKLSACAKVLRGRPNLINMLRYSTKNFQKASDSTK